MAGHSHSSNVKKRKESKDKKKSSDFCKVVIDIINASKNNDDLKLKSAIEKAKKVNLPKEKIDNAIKKGKSENSNDNSDCLIYEGILFSKIMILLRISTDNRNKTNNELKSFFTKYNGRLAETGEIIWQFDEILFFYVENSEEEILNFISKNNLIDELLNIEIENEKCKLKFNSNANIQKIKNNLNVINFEKYFESKEKISIENKDEFEEFIEKIKSNLNLKEFFHNIKDN